MSINASIEQGIENTISSMASAIGSAMASGASVADSAAVALLSSVGIMAKQLGELAIGVGVGMIAIKEAFKNPFSAIAAGIALVALGSYASSKAQSIASGGGGGGGSYTSNNAAINYRPDQQNVSMVGIVRGQNIVIASSNTERSNNRVR
jgi:hypothetical protein